MPLDTVFSYLIGRIDALFNTAVTGIYTSLIGALVAPFKAALVVLIALVALNQLLAVSPQPVERVMKTVVIAAAVFGFVLTAAGYGSWAIDVILNGLTTGLDNAVSAGIGAPPVNGHAFDALAAKAFMAGSGMLNNVGWSAQSLFMGAVALIYLVFAAIGICGCVLAWLIPHVLLFVVVAIGPAPACLAAFPPLRSVFWGWLKTALGLVLLQVLVFVVLALLMQVESEIAKSVLTASQNATASATGSIADQAIGLFVGAAIYLVGAYIAYQVTNVAQSIVGGAYTDIQRGFSLVSNTARGAGNTAVRFVSGQSGSSSQPQARPSPQAQNSNQPPGPAIHRGKP